MGIVGAFDIHRGQLTYDYVCTETGQIERGRIRPADRAHLGAWLARVEGLGEAEFVIEACTGWRYVAEELERAGCVVHLAEPAEAAARKGPKQRAKTDAADARHLRELLQQGRVPESWIPPAEVLEARALIRLYKDLLEERTGWAERIRATLFHQGVAEVRSVLDARGRALLPGLELSAAGHRAVGLALRQIERLSQEAAVLRQEIRARAQAQPACRALTKAHYGVGPLLAYAIWAEMGDARRFTSSTDAVRYAGMDITVYASDSRRAKGHFSRQGQPLLRWALYEAAMSATHASSPDHTYYEAVKARHHGDGKIAVISVARKLARRCHHTLREMGEAWSEAA
jgi:transposase